MAKTVLTVDEAAKVCGVQPRTLRKWLECRRLKGYRQTGSQEWFIPRTFLEKFLDAYGLRATESEARE